MQRDTDIIRKEQIEEIANYYCEYCKRQTGEKFCEHIDDKSCNIFFEAELFYNAGYRKAEEVRKETAKEIFKTIINGCTIDPLSLIYVLRVSTLDRIKIKYGVEVEE